MVRINDPFKKQEKIVIDKKTWGFPFKFYISKNKRPFRLSGVEKTDYGYFTTIFWLDTEKYETFSFEKIEPYLI